MDIRYKNRLEVELEDRLLSISEHDLVLAQALWRGAIARRRFSHLKKSYDEIFKDFEDDTGLHVFWPNSAVLQRPEFLKTYDYKKALEKQSLIKDPQKQSELNANILQQNSTSEYKFLAPELISETTELQESDKFHKLTNVVQCADFKELVPVRDTDEEKLVIETEHDVIEAEQHSQCSDVSSNDQDSIQSSENVVPRLSLERLNEPETNSQILSASNKLSKSTHRTAEVLKPRSSEDSPRSSKHSSTRSHRSNAEAQDVSVRSQRSSTRSPNESDQGQKVKVVHDETNLCDASDMEQRLRGLAQRELLEQRRTVAMELLWIQQAIDSRKQYLHLKFQVTS